MKRQNEGYQDAHMVEFKKVPIAKGRKIIILRGGPNFDEVPINDGSRKSSSLLPQNLLDTYWAIQLQLWTLTAPTWWATTRRAKIISFNAAMPRIGSPSRRANVHLPRLEVRVYLLSACQHAWRRCSRGCVGQRGQGTVRFSVLNKNVST